MLFYMIIWLMMKFLEHAPRMPKRYVGKKAGEHYKNTRSNNELIVEQAKEKMTLLFVLKRGDPLFLVGGEEILAFNGK